MILSLTIGDFIIVSILSPISTVQVASKRYHPCIVNRIGSFFAALVANSGFTISAIAYNRYKIIKDNTNIKTNLKQVLYSIFFPWISPLILVVAKAFDEILVSVVVILLYINCYIFFLFGYIKLIILSKSHSETRNLTVKIQHRKIMKIFTKRIKDQLILSCF